MKKMVPKVKLILREAFKTSSRLGDMKIKPEHIILSLLNDYDNKVLDVLTEMGTDIEDLSSTLEGYILYKTNI